MRSEHRTTGDEFDLVYAKVFYASLNREGAAKAIKARSHRHDRRIAKQFDIADRVRDYYEERFERDSEE